MVPADAESTPASGRPAACGREPPCPARAGPRGRSAHSRSSPACGRPSRDHPLDISREGLLGARRRDVVLAPRGRGHMRRWIIPGGIALFALALGCHHEVEMVPLAERTIYVTDRFYDVQALTKDRAFVVGY